MLLPTISTRRNTPKHLIAVIMHISKCTSQTNVWAYFYTHESDHCLGVFLHVRVRPVLQCLGVFLHARVIPTCQCTRIFLHIPIKPVLMRFMYAPMRPLLVRMFYMYQSHQCLCIVLHVPVTIWPVVRYFPHQSDQYLPVCTSVSVHLV